jgi:FkbM family methyltransferase
MKRAIEHAGRFANALTGGRLTESDRLRSLYNRAMAGTHQFDGFQAYVPPNRIGVQHDPLESFIAEHVPGRTFWDLGANIGYFSLCAARDARLVRAFEPEPSNLQLLRRNVEMNDFDNIEIHQLAVGAENGTVELYRDTTEGSGRHSLAADSGHDGESCSVSARTMDALVEEYEEPDLVKIDVEGAEGRVLEGAMETLESGRVEWLIEVHSPRTGERQDRLGQHGDDVDRLYDRLASNGYTVRGYRDGALVPFEISDETVPLQWYATIEE